MESDINIIIHIYKEKEVDIGRYKYEKFIQERFNVY